MNSMCVCVCASVHAHRESTDHNEVGLLQAQGALPVDDHYPHDSKVPDGKGPGDPVQGQVVHHTDVTVSGRRGVELVLTGCTTPGEGLAVRCVVVW